MNGIPMKNNSILLCCLFMVLFLGACEKEKEIIRPVAIYHVSDFQKYLKLDFPAVVEAGNSSLLSYKVSGPILMFHKELGAFVKKGEVIASLDERDYETQLQAAKEKMLAAKNAYIANKAQADNARKQFVRANALYKEKALAKKKYDEALAMHDGAIAKEKASFAQYKEAEQGYFNKQDQKKDTKLLAPFDGYITKKFADVGAVVSQGMPIVSFSSNGKKKIQLNIAEKDIQLFEKAHKFSFIADKNTYPLKMQTLGKVKQSLELVYPVILFFTEENALLAGTEGTVQVLYANTKENSLEVPVEAVLKQNNQAFVWTVQENIITKKIVEIIQVTQDGKLLVRGLVANDKIVAKGVHELHEGQKVRILEEFSKANVGEIL